MSDEQIHLPMSGSFEFTYELTDIDPELAELVIGGSLHEAHLTKHSVELTTVQVVSGEPPRPPWKRGLWARLTRENRRATQAWRAEREAWVAAGRPDREQFCYMLFPEAVISEIEVRNEEDDD